MSKSTSRLPGFYKMKMAERLRKLADALELDDDDLEGLGQSGTLPLFNADAMIENAVGVLGLPVGLGLNFVVNGEEVLVPMAVEEPSVIAAASLVAWLDPEHQDEAAELLSGALRLAQEWVGLSYLARSDDWLRDIHGNPVGDYLKA